jgi:hypothetical protein
MTGDFNYNIKIIARISLRGGGGRYDERKERCQHSHFLKEIKRKWGWKLTAIFFHNLHDGPLTNGREFSWPS